MQKTMFNQWGYPEFKEKPYYETFKKFIGDIDLDTYYLKTISNSFLCGGGTLSWNGSLGLLSWTVDFAVPLTMSGYVILVKYGPDAVNRAINITPGGFAYIQLPTVIQDNTTRNMRAAATWTGTPGVYAIAMNYNNICYLRNGTVLT